MVTKWRRAFCTTIPRDPESLHHHHHQQRRPSNHQHPPETSVSHPTTPTLRCRTAAAPPCKSGEKRAKSTPSLPRSPFSILKNSLRLSRRMQGECGVCKERVKPGQGRAIYTAECSHIFHFPCISAHVSILSTPLFSCPVCNLPWKDVPLLSLHPPPSLDSDAPVIEKTITTAITTAASTKTRIDDKKVKTSAGETRFSERSYNDDEPLLSPITGGRFNPIPEADEDEFSEEIEEFQGFCVNSNPNHKIESFNLNNHPKISRNVEVKLLPEAAVISAGKSYETYAIALRVKASSPPPSGRATVAPILSPAHRAGIDLVTVLDLRESMKGEKLDMLKRAMRLVISSLGSADRLSIVAYATAPQRLMPLRRMTAQGQRSARLVIDRLGCGQGTGRASEALRKASKVLEDRREKNTVASIMLLSDGQDSKVNNTSNQRKPSPHMSSTRFAHIEIPVHPSGYGLNPDSHTEPAEDSFAKCVGGLLSVVVQDLRVQLGLGSGSAPGEIMGVYSTWTGQPTLMRGDSVRFGSLYAQEERELLIELKMPTSAIGSHHVISVHCTYRDPVTQEVMYGKERALLVPRPHAVRSSEPRIQRLRNFFIAIRAVAQSRRLVEHSDFAGAYQLLTAAREVLTEDGEEYMKVVEAELAEVDRRRKNQMATKIQRWRGQAVATATVEENGESLTPTSAWRAAERLAKMAIMKKALNKVSDLHGFENARF